MELPTLPVLSAELQAAAAPVLTAVFEESDGGLQDLIRPEGVRKLLPRLALHTLYCHLLLHRQAAAALKEITEGGNGNPVVKCDPALPLWTYHSAYSNCLVGILEIAIPWFHEEMNQIMNTLMEHETDLLGRRYAAPEQMLWQWYTGRFTTALEELEHLKLRAAPPEETTILNFIQESQRLSALAEKIPVRWVMPQRPQIR